MVAQTLTLLHNWFVEPSAGNDRPKLLSKFAVLELCGWLEWWMDDFVIELSRNCLHDDQWTGDMVVQKTFGFEYGTHLRPMVCKLLGEHLTRVTESRFERQFPGDLDTIKSMLGSLWKIRCQFAHNDLTQNIAQQTTFNAPSWTINQHRIISKKLENFRVVGVAVAAAAPAG